MVDEKVLVSRVLNGDRVAFKLLIKQYERLVLTMVGRLVDNQDDREELCQDVFLKVYQKLSDFNFQSKLSTWIATIAYRQSINHLKKRKLVFSDLSNNHDDKDLMQQNAIFIDHITPGKLTEDTDFKLFIEKVLGQLPIQYRTVLTLFHLNEMSYPEIQKITGMPEGTVKNYLFRARKLLKEKLKVYLVKEEFL